MQSAGERKLKVMLKQFCIESMWKLWIFKVIKCTLLQIFSTAELIAGMLVLFQPLSYVLLFSMIMLIFG